MQAKPKYIHDKYDSTLGIYKEVSFIAYLFRFFHLEGGTKWRLNKLSIITLFGLRTKKQMKLWLWDEGLVFRKQKGIALIQLLLIKHLYYLKMYQNQFFPIFT